MKKGGEWEGNGITGLAGTSPLAGTASGQVKKRCLCRPFLTSGFSFSLTEMFGLLPFTKPAFLSSSPCYFSSCPRMKAFGLDFISLGVWAILLPGGLVQV